MIPTWLKCSVSQIVERKHLGLLDENLHTDLMRKLSIAVVSIVIPSYQTGTESLLVCDKIQ